MSSQNPTLPADSGSDPEADLLFELFEEALSLHSAGIAYESVLAKCPPAFRAQLHEQLDMAMHLQATAPAMARPRNQAQRVSNRAAFIRAAHSLGNKPAPAAKSPLDAIGEAWENLARRLDNLIPQFSPRFAPILAMIALLLIGTVGVGTAAASALPGDIIYPVKEFVRDTRESLASPTEKGRVIQENENARRQDTEKAATQRQELIEVTRDMQFYQKGESVWDIGGQTVLPGYPPDPLNRPNHLLPMDFNGDPQPGDIVRLTYLIVPGKPNFVYGKRLVVLETITLIATSTPAAIIVVVAPTATPTLAPVVCEPTKPAGWVDYRVGRNDTLEGLAVNTGVQAELIKQVNCRQSVDVGATVSLPAVIGVTLPDPNQPETKPTPTAIPVLTPTPLPTVAEPTATEVAAPTVEETATAEATTPAATATEVVEATPTEEAATAVATPSATSEGGGVIDTPTVIVETPVAEDTATATVEVENTATETSTPVDATPTPTEEASATTTPTGEEATATAVAETPTTEAPPSATQVGSATATPIAETPIPDTPIATPVPQATATPLSEQPTAIPVEPTAAPAEPTVSAGGDNSSEPTLLPPATEIPAATEVPTSAP